ncbi:hypothetical protein ACFX2H_033550 [Malus domestica]
MRPRRGGDQPKMQEKTVDAGASGGGGGGGGGEGITCGGCRTPVSMVLDDDHHHVHMDLQELPEGCIAKVVSLTTPRDACRFSAVSKSFMSAADSDAVWDKFLPPDIPSILSQSSSSSSTSSSSKKKLYLTLCENPVLVDDGKMSFTLDKWSGKKCYMISPKDLMIAWGGTPAYWKWISLANSRFEEVAELVVVWWLEIRGKIDTRILSPSTVYKAYLVFMLSERARGFDRDDPLEVKVGLFGEEETNSKRTVFLGQERSLKKRPDGWPEVVIGEFFCPGEEDGGLMEMTCMEVDRMKRGLIVQGIEVRPKRMKSLHILHKFTNTKTQYNIQRQITGTPAMDLEALPEGCKATVASLTTPPDACRLSAVSRGFRSAAESDAAWDRFLPPDVYTILGKSSVQPQSPSSLPVPPCSSSSSSWKSKKELFLSLCDNPVLIDQGKMSFSVDKWSGKKCYMISARELIITWGDTPQYWEWICLPESRFDEVAEVVHVWWLEIRGKIDMRILSPATTYEAYLVFKLREGAYGFEVPVKVTTGEDGEPPIDNKNSTVFLDPEAGRRRQKKKNNNRKKEETHRFPKERADSWLEVKLGEFFCPGGGDGKLTEMTCKEVAGVLKAGLIVHGIEVRPKKDKVEHLLSHALSAT